MITQPVASTMIIALSWRHSSDIEMSILSRLAESLRLQLANMSGTEKAESWGEAEEEIVVSLQGCQIQQIKNKKEKEEMTGVK